MADSEAQQNHATANNNNNPSKYYNHFLFKAAIVTVFLVLLPLFPSQAPDFLNHSRSREILQLIFVGIAVSYGLFSSKSDGVIYNKENVSSRIDNAQSYVSRLLQVSSVFDDESEDPSLFDDNSNNNNKVIHTWNNQYHRGEPVVVVAKDSPVLEEQRGVSVNVKSHPRIGEKPLLLPVRSLKSRVLEEDKNGEAVAVVNNMPGLSPVSRREEEEKKAEEENFVVLPSPIPWRSRSGIIEIPSETKLFSSSSMEDPEFNKLEPPPPSKSHFKSQSFKIPSESQIRVVEETGRKKAPAAPPPPPPAPHFFSKSSSMKSSSTNDAHKELRRSVPTNTEQNDAAFPGKSVRTFTPFNGRGRSYGNGNSNIAKKDEDLECEEEEEYDDFCEEGLVKGSEESVGDGGPDVDKKADEFIAKFREQIRLQRIESIRRSSWQPARNQLVK